MAKPVRMRTKLSPQDTQYDLLTSCWPSALSTDEGGGTLPTMGTLQPRAYLPENREHDDGDRCRETSCG